MAHGSERKMEMELKETIDEYITVFEKTERAKIQAMLDAVDCDETTKLYGLQADLSFTQGCLYMLRTIKEEMKDEKQGRDHPAAGRSPRGKGNIRGRSTAGDHRH